MGKWFRRVAPALIAVAISAAAITYAHPSVQNEGIAWVRWVNGTSHRATLAIDSRADSLPELDFGQSSGYIALPPGDHRLELLAGAETLAESEISPEAGSAITIVAVESNEGFALPTFADNLSPLMPGSARLNLLHVSPDAPTLALALPDETLIMTDVGYGDFGSVELATGTYPLTIVDATKPDIPVLEPEELSLRTGMSYDLIVIGSVLGEPQVTSLVASAPVVPDEDERLVRFIHALPGTPALDVYLDGTLMLPGLEPGEVTPYFPLPAREATVLCREIGRLAGEPVLTGAIEPAVAQGTTFVIGANGIATLADDLSSPPPGKTRLTVINAMAEGQITLVLPDGGALIGDIPPSDAGSIDLFIATYRVWIAWNGAELLEPFDISLGGNRLYTLVVGMAPDISATLSEATPWEQRVSLATGAGVPAPETGFPIATVNVPEGANLLLRQGPGQEYDFSARIPRGEELIVLGRDTTGAWLLVRYAAPDSEEPLEGWVATEWVTLTLNDEPLPVREIPVAE